MRLRIFHWLFIALLFILSCKEDVDDLETDESPPTIAEWVLAQNQDYDTLKLALEKSGLLSKLDEAGSYTLIAQNNQGFGGLPFYYASLSNGNISLLAPEEVNQVMQNNIFSERIQLLEENEGQYYKRISKTAPNGRSPMYYFDLKNSRFTNSLLINKSIAITTLNIQATNGVIHIIDRLLSPSSLLDFVLQNDSLSMLGQVVPKLFDLVNFLNNTAGVNNSIKTFFAPSNKAFRELIASDSSLNSVYDIKEERLRKMLNHHIVSGINLTKEQLTNGSLATRNNDSLMITTSNELIINSSGQVSARITTENVQSNDGIMHIIDRVLLPQ